MSKMSISNISSGKITRPIRAVLYGVEGIGKSTFGAGAPSAIFLAAEDGTHHLDVDRFPLPSNWSEALDAIGVLFTEKHKYKTLVVDTVDWCQMLAADAVCQEHNVANLEDIPYGKWKSFLLAKMRELLQALDALYGARDMHIILIAHAEIKRFNDPETDDYDRYSIKALPSFAAMLSEWCDVLAFANYDRTVQKGEGFAKTKAKSFGKRQMFTQHAAAYDAKNRYSLPDRLNLDWSEFYAAVTGETQTVTTEGTKGNE